MAARRPIIHVIMLRSYRAELIRKEDCYDALISLFGGIPENMDVTALFKKR